MFLGIDVGSVSTDAVLINSENYMHSYTVVKSGFDHKAAIDKAVDNICKASEIDISNVKCIVSTGYGRRNVAGASTTITEISCHAMGVHALFPEARTVIDIGGQDSKVIRVNNEGFVENFVMNDKCAAGTGRFLEVMAHAMGVEIQELGELSIKAAKSRSISSICTVFAESEVISRIAEGNPKEEIIAGIHKAIGERIMGMSVSVGIKEPVALTGGVAKNPGVIKAISGYLKCKLYIPPEPQLTGALGAAIYAKRYSK